MKDSIEQKVLHFYKQLGADEHHRYLSWEHCYTYFGKKNLDVDTACLHLAFYLASWGMYRGSSSLLWKDYLIHKDVVNLLLDKRHLRSIRMANYSKAIGEIVELCNSIRNHYSEINEVNGKVKKIKATNTLVTKIVMGALGCVPAYDTYFIDGLRTEKISPLKPSAKGIKAIEGFYGRHQNSFDRLQKKIRTKSGLSYPVMKLVDMYFWQIGYEKDQKRKKRKVKIKS